MSDIYTHIDRMNARRQRERIKKEYGELTEAQLAAKTPKELAAWQAEYPPESPQHILASQEWNRRLIATQVRWMQFSVIAGLAGVVIGAVLSALLTPKPTVSAPNVPNQVSQESEPRKKETENSFKFEVPH